MLFGPLNFVIVSTDKTLGLGLNFGLNPKLYRDITNAYYINVGKFKVFQFTCLYL